MGDNRHHGWSDERVARLTRDWLAGLSALQIAGRLGGGVTRNAVIGKLGRLGLLGVRGPEIASGNRTQALKVRYAAERAANPRPVKAVRPPQAPPTVAERPKAKPPAPAAVRPALVVVGGTAAKPAPPPLVAQGQPEPRHLTLTQLETGVCRWPIGEGEAMTFCGCATPDVSDPVQPYCAYHRRRAYQAAKPRLTGALTKQAWARRHVTRSEMFRQAAGGR